MAHRTDLYSILIAYANKNNSPYVEINAFLEFLGKYAKKQSLEDPEWLKWTENRNVKFWAEVSALAEEGKCEVLTDTDNGRIYMSHFYLDLIAESYSNADKDADLPFPNEESLRISLPENQLKTLSTEEDIIVYLKEPQSSNIPILKINFGYGFSNALVLASLVPRRLIEMSVLKLRNYLQHYGNKEYAIRKLTPQLQGRESFLKEQFNQIMVKPLEACKTLEEGRELSFLFWAHFCILVKNDIRKKKDHLGEDIAAFQSVYILETFNGYYKALANRKREEELAFRALENHLSKPPFLYTLGQILQFRNSNGLPLLGQYSKEGLDSWIKKATTESKNNELPSLLVLQSYDDERYFCFKDRMVPLCTRLLNEGQKLIAEAVSKRWRKLFLDYQREPAMDNDAEFEKLLARLTKKLCPMLSALLDDPKLMLIYEEMERSHEGSAAFVKLFSNGKLAPFSTLYLLRRKEMLVDTKLVLPFWYSIPILTAIIVFIKSLGKKRSAVRLAHDNEEADTPEEKNQTSEIREAAEEIEAKLVPPGYTLDTYLEELENRWSRLIDKKARDNLIEDVKSLLRDHLRSQLKLQKKFHLTRQAISQMAAGAIVRSPTLSAMSGRDFLILYSELYMLKLLQNIR